MNTTLPVSSLPWSRTVNPWRWHALAFGIGIGVVLMGALL